MSEFEVRGVHRLDSSADKIEPSGCSRRVLRTHVEIKKPGDGYTVAIWGGRSDEVVGAIIKSLFELDVIFGFNGSISLE